MTGAGFQMPQESYKLPLDEYLRTFANLLSRDPGTKELGQGLMWAADQVTALMIARHELQAANEQLVAIANGPEEEIPF